MNSRPRGRRPGDSGTRAAILAAARARFATHGYDRTRIRDVAADATVDPALVHYFFKTKDGLFAAAMELPFRPAELLGREVAQGADGLGERLVRRMLSVWDDPAHRGALLSIVHGAAAHEGAATALREFITSELAGRIASVAAQDRPRLRANLVASQVVGLMMIRYVVRVEPLASLESREVVALVGPTLQRYIDGDLAATHHAAQ
jgi:AcrR family transcriptional regulator